MKTRCTVDGEEYRLFTFEYGFDRKRFTGEVWARDWDEAQAKVQAMGWGKVDGQLLARVPASIGWWIPLFVWFRRLWRA